MCLSLGGCMVWWVVGVSQELNYVKLLDLYFNFLKIINET